MSGIRIISRAAAFCAAALLSAPAAAHPHVFVEHAVEIRFDEHGVASLRLSWTFDEMYSSMIREDFVKTKSGGKLSAADIRTIEQKAFSNLANFGYFTEITINAQKVPIAKVTEFDAGFAQGKATYHFTIPLRTPNPAAQNTLEVTVFDPEYFVDYKLRAADPMVVKPGAAMKPDCKILRDIQRKSDYGQIASDTFRCTYGRGG